MIIYPDPNTITITITNIIITSIIILSIKINC